MVMHSPSRVSASGTTSSSPQGNPERSSVIELETRDILCVLLLLSTRECLAIENARSASLVVPENNSTVLLVLQEQLLFDTTDGFSPVWKLRE